MYNNKPTQYKRGNSMQNIRQGQDSRTAWMCPQYSGVYGQQPRTPFAVGHAQTINGTMRPMMNPESSWTTEHHQFPPNQSRSNFGQQRGFNYNATPASNQVRSSYGTGFQQKPQPQVRPSYGTGFQQRPQPQMYTQNPQTSVPVAKISLPEGQPGQVLTGKLPPELQNNPNINYVNLNWEDILGGKGLGGLQVSMAPTASGNPNQNRQIRIGMAGDQSPNDGSTPLKIVSFEPLKDFPGKINPTGNQNQVKTNVPTYQTGTFSQPQQSAAYQMPGYTGRVGQFGSQQTKKCGSCTACQFKQPYSSRR